MDLCKKKQKKTKESRFAAHYTGDCYAYIAIKRNTRLHLAHSVGARTDETADSLIWKLSFILSLPTFTHPVEIYTDGNEQYLKALNNYFRKDSVVYGRLVKHKRFGYLVWKCKEKIYRNPNYEDIDTTVIENYNSILRERISRLVRRSRCFSQHKRRFEQHLDIFQAYNNLIKVYGKETPMMKEEKTNKIWQWKDLFMYQ